MAAKDVRFSTDARDRILRGVDILANAFIAHFLHRLGDFLTDELIAIG